VGLHLLRVQRAAGQRPGAGQRGGSGGVVAVTTVQQVPHCIGSQLVRITCRRAQSRATGTRACDRVDCRKVLIDPARTRFTRRISRVQLRIPPRASLARCPTGQARGPKAHGRSGSRNRKHKLGRLNYGRPQCPSVEAARNLPDTAAANCQNTKDLVTTGSVGGKLEVLRTGLAGRCRPRGLWLSSRGVFCDRKIASHNGQLVKTKSSGFLVEFSSVIDGVPARCSGRWPNRT
jgi:hypothetical protein